MTDEDIVDTTRMMFTDEIETMEGEVLFLRTIIEDILDEALVLIKDITEGAKPRGDNVLRIIELSNDALRKV